jgi:hypothetical protein
LGRPQIAHFSTLRLAPSLVRSSANQLSHADVLAEWLTRRRSRRAEMLTSGGR